MATGQSFSNYTPERTLLIASKESGIKPTAGQAAPQIPCTPAADEETMFKTIREWLKVGDDNHNVCQLDSRRFASRSSHVARQLPTRLIEVGREGGQTGVPCGEHGTEVTRVHSRINGTQVYCSARQFSMSRLTSTAWTLISFLPPSRTRSK